MLCGQRPVSSAARLGEQTGAAENAWRNSSPWSASRWMFGVDHLMPVRLDVPARVVGVDEDDVREACGHSRQPQCSLSSVPTDHTATLRDVLAHLGPNEEKELV